MRLLKFAAAVALATGYAAPAAQAQDAAAGQALFQQRCTSCHTANEGGASASGPNLFGISGSIASNRSGISFNYSDALIDSGIIWNDDNLDAWLESPDDFVPGNKMPFPGLADAGERANIIAYLKTLK